MHATECMILFQIFRDTLRYYQYIKELWVSTISVSIIRQLSILRHSALTRDDNFQGHLAYVHLICQAHRVIKGMQAHRHMTQLSFKYCVEILSSTANNVQSSPSCLVNEKYLSIPKLDKVDTPLILRSSIEWLRLLCKVSLLFHTHNTYTFTYFHCPLLEDPR